MPLPLQRKRVRIFVPDGVPLAEALKRTTHLGIGAHPDDLEFMAFHGIASCYESEAQWFGAITCANSFGIARMMPTGRSRHCSPAETRWVEQKAAARLGRYSFAIQLNYPSGRVRRVDPMLVRDLKAILEGIRPRIVYTHNPVDKHLTHVGVCLAVIAAIRRLRKSSRPLKVLGCEVWRALDWLVDDEKVVLDVSRHQRLARALVRVYKSQLQGGKRYDWAVEGRMRANATFLDPRAPDAMEKAWYAMELTPLTREDDLDVVEFTLAAIDRFRRQVENNLQRSRR